MTDLQTATQGYVTNVSARAAFAAMVAGDYSTLPTEDVQILEGTAPRCRSCSQGLKFIPPSTPGRPGEWVHFEPADHRPVNGPRCRYCGCNDDQVTFEQHAWYDAVECARCGAVQGWAIGD